MFDHKYYVVLKVYTCQLVTVIMIVITGYSLGLRNPLDLLRYTDRYIGATDSSD